jgi:hypothetical protein
MCTPTHLAVAFLLIASNLKRQQFSERSASPASCNSEALAGKSYKMRCHQNVFSLFDDFDDFIFCTEKWYKK